MMSNVTGGHDPAGIELTVNELTGHDPAELGELERSVLQLMWQHGTLSADQVREELDLQDRPLKDSTVRTVLRRLEEKGYLTHILDNRTFLYSPAEPAPMVAGRAVKRILEWFCEGSVEQLLVGMVDSSVLDRKELKRLAERIAAAQDATQTGVKTQKANGKGEK
jgi:BlaI family transcriptional regulator, penicillinase repressor